MPFMPVEGVKRNAKPCPGRRLGYGEMEIMKEVEKGRSWDEFEGLVGID